MIAWHPADADRVADPGVALPLLQRAIAAAPASAPLRAQLDNFLLDRFDFDRAAAAFEVALRLDPAARDVRIRLARCWARLGRPAEVLALIADAGPAPSAHLQFQQGMAALALGQGEAAELAFREALDQEPGHRGACFELGRMLRGQGRVDDLRALCADLAGKGVRHAQLLLDWGRAAALSGDTALARRLLFDPRGIGQTTLPVPAGFDSLAAFNAAVAADLLTNAHAITDVPADELAMRGAARVEHLMNGARPALIRTLLGAIQAAIDRHVAVLVDTAPPGPPDPWLEGRPAEARLHAWGLIQQSGDYEDWHTHRGGWLSGVYYVQIPELFSAEGAGAGCIEFGPPPSLDPALAPAGPYRVAPREGMLLFTPSHYHHRTIPFVSDRRRISFAFDVCPV